MEAQQTTDDELAAEINRLVTVDEVHKHDHGYAVVFATNTVPSAFTEKMLSEGYALEHVDASDELIATFKTLTEF
jgi:hypothetical protein